jgi:hypothetical protein
MSLTSCIKQAGDALKAERKAQLHAAAGQHRRAGLENDTAGLKAAEEVLAKAEGELAAAEAKLPVVAPEDTPAHDTSEQQKKPQGGRSARGAAWDRNPLRYFLATHGINASLTREFAPGEKERRSALVPGVGPIFKKTGLQLDALAQRAVEEGFLKEPDATKLHSMITAALNGERIAPMYAEGVAEQESERLLAARHDAEEALADLPQQAYDDDNIPWGEVVSNASVEDAMRALGFSEQEIHDAIAQESSSPQEDRPSGGGTDEAAAGGAPEGAGRRAQEPGASPDEGLTAPTERELIERQRQRRDAEKAQAKRRADEEAKAAADAERGEFTLTGSDRPADVAAAGGQKDIFSAADSGTGNTPSSDQPRGKAFWLKAVADHNRLAKQSGKGVTLQAGPNGKPTFQGDPRATKEGRAFLATYEEAIKAGATPAQILAAVASTAAPQAQAELVAERAPTAPSATEDAGAELTYNRRNRVRRGLKWDDLKDKDAALRVRETTKEKVYPKPDYEQLVGEVLHPVVAHIVKQAYDAIAAKPQTRGAPTDEQLRGYIEGVNRYMDGVIAWAHDEAKVRAWLAQVGTRASALAGAAGGQRTSLADIAGAANPSLAESVYPTPEGAMRNSGWRSHEGELRLIGGNKALRGLQPSVDDAMKALKEIEKGWPGKREAWQQRGYQILPQDVVPKEDYYVGERYGSKEPYVYAHVIVPWKGRHLTLASQHFAGIKDTQDPRVQEWMANTLGRVLGKHLLLNKANVLQGAFDTEEQAKERARELTKRDTSGQIVDEKGTSVEHAERTGPARRTEGENITSERLMDAFGFRGVNFGNWMKGKGNEAERQLHLNHAYDSFMDLADLIGVPPKAMSLNGMLGLAIGAQGSGKGVAAHFVPGVNEINITRTAGAGSLAHEWGHALDHYFARQAGFERLGDPFLTEHTSRPAGEGLRPEILAKFREIVTAMNKRPVTQEEAKQMQQAALDRARSTLKSWTDAVRRDFEGVADKASLDKLLARIEQGDLGDYVDRQFTQSITALRNDFKRAKGRLYSVDSSKGLQSAAQYVSFLQEKKQAEADHKPQLVTSEYAREAAKLDKEKGGKPYFDTNLEKFARAFDAFVSDQLAERVTRNTYLSHADRGGPTVPHGEERTRINTAFKALVDTIETKETDQGTAMFALGPRWRSDLTEAVQGSTMKAAPAAGWQEFLSGLTKRGVKPDEIEWSGIRDWLKMQPGKVSRDQVLEYLRENGVQVQEVVKGKAAEMAEADDFRVQIDALGFTIGTMDGDSGTYMIRRSDGKRFVYDNGWDAFVPEDDQDNGDARLDRSSDPNDVKADELGRLYDRRTIGTTTPTTATRLQRAMGVTPCRAARTTARCC